MSAIWREQQSKWEVLAPVGFADEATLHGLIEHAPQLLPLAGSPELIIIGREVQLGTNSADLIAIEPSGRLVIIEIKLARNSESRRAVVAQILTYAAFLDRLDLGVLERDVLGKHLQRMGVTTLADAVEQNDQSGSFDRNDFQHELETSLQEGRFRLVIVLDEAPGELVRLVGYLERVGDKLTIDLVSVSSYDVENSQILVPQRIEPARYEAPSAGGRSGSVNRSAVSRGADDFLSAIAERPDHERQPLQRLVDWAVSLERDRLAQLSTTTGTTRSVLRVLLPGRDGGMVSISSACEIWLWRSVFERFAPGSLPRLEAAIAPRQVGQGNTIRDIPDDVLTTLADAYREAATKPEGELGGVAGLA
jgi:hypothetical protein